MIDAMGGVNSKYYKDFQTICSKSYNILRRHTNIFLILLTTLSQIQPSINNGIFTKKFIRKQVIKRFVPGETYADAKLQYITKMNNNYNTNTTAINDFVHYQNKEHMSKVNDIFRNLSSYIYNIFTPTSDVVS